uniref:Uncharacterized protein n=1 Tax=Chromera velia CCMP2878 TaxID=1169474 RepID=A0A0G4IAR0_9ALVE|eukprot:Cvel_12513.t1-p1 / transcript=Cvel_12513.t1 / gene=Cvel_12513 / organism=Chromera_velia_CCMP2878 / gene_product=hypothetical protein / transcript_product=hypothetical protein / location=Cvel_scaffold821:28304-30473(+) / protein_length=189 / sequence_SO=supercontig / SO=protein_coding / is_pseudo=false
MKGKIAAVEADIAGVEAALNVTRASPLVNATHPQYTQLRDDLKQLRDHVTELQKEENLLLAQQQQQASASSGAYFEDGIDIHSGDYTVKREHFVDELLKGQTRKLIVLKALPASGKKTTLDLVEARLKKDRRPYYRFSARPLRSPESYIRGDYVKDGIAVFSGCEYVLIDDAYNLYGTSEKVSSIEEPA